MIIFDLLLLYSVVLSHECESFDKILLCLIEDSIVEKCSTSGGLPIVKYLWCNRQRFNIEHSFTVYVCESDPLTDACISPDLHDQRELLKSLLNNKTITFC